MTDTLLRSIRDHVLDENEPLAGLLRKCLLLGAETGSISLRDWARLELNGYEADAALPEYRRVAGVPMTMDSMSGNTWATGQTLTQAEMPPAARQYLSEFLNLTQPVEELARLAAEKSLHFKPPALAVAQGVWNRELGPFQQIVNLSYVMPGSAFAGILGQIRTKLVDMVADLTATTPLTELPRREDVDAAFKHRIGHIGDIYTTTVVEPAGPTAIGSGATASTGVSIDEVLRLLAAVQIAAGSDTEGSEIRAAVSLLEQAVTSDKPDTAEVMKRAGALKAIAEKLGIAAVSSATSTAVSALTNLALQGAFS